jgi:hypothetical protein
MRREKLTFTTVDREDKRSRRKRYYFLSEYKNPNFHLFHLELVPNLASVPNKINRLFTALHL